MGPSYPYTGRKANAKAGKPKVTRYYFYHRREAHIFAFTVACNLGICNDEVNKGDGKEEDRPYSPYYAEFHDLTAYAKAKLDGAHEGFRWGDEVRKMVWQEKNHRYSYPDPGETFASVEAEEAADEKAIEDYRRSLKPTA